MTYAPDFDKDLRFGEAREDAFVHVLLRSRVEHKTDRKCVETGNVAVEYEQRCRDGEIRKSGISLSKADRYAIEFVPDRWLIIPLDELKMLARRAIQEGKHKWIGDGNNHHNALVPFAWFREVPGDIEWSLTKPDLPPAVVSPLRSAA